MNQRIKCYVADLCDGKYDNYSCSFFSFVGTSGQLFFDDRNIINIHHCKTLMTHLFQYAARTIYTKFNELYCSLLHKEKYRQHLMRLVIERRIKSETFGKNQRGKKRSHQRNICRTVTQLDDLNSIIVLLTQDISDTQQSKKPWLWLTKPPTKGTSLQCIVTYKS